MLVNNYISVHSLNKEFSNSSFHTYKLEDLTAVLKFIHNLDKNCEQVCFKISYDLFGVYCGRYIYHFVLE